VLGPQQKNLIILASGERYPMNEANLWGLFCGMYIMQTLYSTLELKWEGISGTSKMLADWKGPNLVMSQFPGCTFCGGSS